MYDKKKQQPTNNNKQSKAQWIQHLKKSHLNLKLPIKYLCMLVDTNRPNDIFVWYIIQSLAKAYVPSYRHHNDSIY